MDKVFRFKQFSVGQSDCGMKVNTDAVLLGAMAEAPYPGNILEIGTGTGVIAMMIAQRYPEALTDAIEIEGKAAARAALNFSASPFSDRLRLIHSSFEQYFADTDKKYDLILSNPPYFIDSLKGGNSDRDLARHTDRDFFTGLIREAVQHLTKQGALSLILPPDTAAWVLKHAEGKLYLRKQVFIHSFPDSEPYRTIITLGSDPVEEDEIAQHKFTIYQSRNIYAEEYRDLLKDYLIIF